jgi:hypothetical protein
VLCCGAGLSGPTRSVRCAPPVVAVEGHRKGPRQPRRLLVGTRRLQRTICLRTQLRLGGVYKTGDLRRGEIRERVEQLSAGLLRCEAVVKNLADMLGGAEGELYIWWRVAYVHALRGHDGQEVAGVVGVRRYG